MIGIFDFFDHNTDFIDLCQDIFGINPIHGDHDLLEPEHAYEVLLNGVNNAFSTDYDVIADLPALAVIDFVHKTNEGMAQEDVCLRDMLKAIQIASGHASGTIGALLVVRPSPLQYCIPSEIQGLFGINLLPSDDRIRDTKKLIDVYKKNGFKLLSQNNLNYSIGWGGKGSESELLGLMMRDNITTINSLGENQ